MNKILLTFDYEIYFDGSNLAEELLENTTQILTISKKFNSKLVFFIDAWYLLKLKEIGLNETYLLLELQIQEMLKQGHEIQYHYHPHWIHSKYSNENSDWTIDKSEFSFSDMVEKYGIEEACLGFKKGIEFLQNVFQYKPQTYRAGGLSIDKNQKELIELLLECGFSIDSSVFPGLYLQGQYLNSDHRLFPNDAIWRIDKENGFFKNSLVFANSLLEIPVMALEKKMISFFTRLINSLNYRFANKFSKYKNYNQTLKGKQMNLNTRISNYPTSFTFDKSKQQDHIIQIFYFTIFEY